MEKNDLDNMNQNGFEIEKKTKIINQRGRGRNKNAKNIEEYWTSKTLNPSLSPSHDLEASQSLKSDTFRT